MSETPCDRWSYPEDDFLENMGEDDLYDEHVYHREFRVRGGRVLAVLHWIEDEPVIQWFFRAYGHRPVSLHQWVSRQPAHGHGSAIPAEAAEHHFFQLSQEDAEKAAAFIESQASVIH